LDIFDEEARDEVARSLIAMVTILRRFFYGNIVVGLILSAACLALFLPLGLPYPYFLALFSGFITLIPYLGAVLAISVPLLPALEQFGNSAAFGVLLAGLLIIHLVGFNLLLSKMVGSMIHLNPLVATVALLVWSWMWGAMGLILAMPIVAAGKAVCDNVPSLRPYGRLLGTW
jgi:predicted PurR-regulated permease PerM